VRDLAASAPVYEALLGFLGYTRVKQEAALHVWDLVRDGGVVGAVILGAPAEYPQYGAGAAAAFVSDPDGLKLEVVPFTG